VRRVPSGKVFSSTTWKRTAAVSGVVKAKRSGSAPASEFPGMGPKTTMESVMAAAPDSSRRIARTRSATPPPAFRTTGATVPAFPSIAAAWRAGARSGAAAARVRLVRPAPAPPPVRSASSNRGSCRSGMAFEKATRKRLAAVPPGPRSPKTPFGSGIDTQRTSRALKLRLSRSPAACAVKSKAIESPAARRCRASSALVGALACPPAILNPPVKRIPGAAEPRAPPGARGRRRATRRGWVRSCSRAPPGARATRRTCPRGSGARTR
jgi:hypothetical protein